MGTVITGQVYENSHAESDVGLALLALSTLNSQPYETIPCYHMPSHGALFDSAKNTR
jgi:hypothetical protein